jgi:hypothetical protein
VCHHSQGPPLEAAGAVRYNSRSRGGNSAAKFTTASLLNSEASPRQDIEMEFCFEIKVICYLAHTQMEIMTFLLS